MQYFDDYATCESTFATFLVSSVDLDWDAISKILGVEPTRINDRARLRASECNRQLVHVWMFSTLNLVESRDLRRHLHFLLPMLSERSIELSKLRELGCRTEISCFWSSAAGHGGPIIDTQSSQIIGSLELDIWFDFFDASAECDETDSTSD